MQLFNYREDWSEIKYLCQFLDTFSISDMKQKEKNEAFWKWRRINKN